MNDANTDPLTNLFNRRKLLSEWHNKSSFNNKIVILGDIDNFKKVNDHHGHNIGDFILIEVANLLREGCRSSDVVARIGGEEFAIVATKISLEEAYLMVERIRKKLRVLHLFITLV